ncbi:GNAT family N-acetyltransferase [Paenibacillus sp. sptzw28]|uniref:GNAT family N-acetyltransferase n=1 Tax=Paenibacillus sp. sptzw28 TaxID=715179 RepID=UPI001C6E7720|nr:GNAT family protein [Paenibacillus sp. sptzw28]QYR22422.1 GNAT family N-acetyltransferase [Paenibacillus sp. sptzw28]
MNKAVLFDQFPTLQSDSLLLRKMVETDTDAFFDMISNTELYKYNAGIPKKNKKIVPAMFGHIGRDFKKQKIIRWGVCKLESPEVVIGVMEAFGFNSAINVAGIGFYFNQSCWNQGIATEAVRVVVDFLLTQAGMNRVWAEVMVNNEASKRVLLKNGFTKEGTLRQARIWTGQGLIDVDHFGILKEDHLCNND